MVKAKKMEMDKSTGKIDTESEVSDLDDVVKLLNVLELILDQAYVGIIFVDPKGIIRFMNQQYEELIGIDRKETYGKHITEFFPDSQLPFVIKTKKVQLGRKYNYKGRGTLIVNRIPIYKGRQFIGAITQCIFRDISEIKEMAKKLDLLKTKVLTYKKTIADLLVPRYNFDDIIGTGEAITRLKNLAQKYAETDNTILITGETGTGKELFAHSIHHASRRSEGPIVCVNCATIPNELLESELFGYAPGAFTGAQQKGKTGKLELADGGTLFLDEVGELPLRAQAKLLRVLEEKRVERVGEVIPVEVDFRLIAATNRNPDFLLDEGRFRQDLYYRLSTMTLAIPPLRKQTEDIPILVNHFIQERSARTMKITDNALHVLMTYSWPGNVRELKNALELSICLVQKGNAIDIDQLPPHIIEAESSTLQNMKREDLNLKKKFKYDEVQSIKSALNFCGGNKSRAAKLLGISRSSLYNKIKHYSLPLR